MAPRVPVPTAPQGQLRPFGRSFQNINPRVQAQVPAQAFGGGGELVAVERSAGQSAALAEGIAGRAIREMDVLAHSEALLAETDAKNRAMQKINASRGKESFGALTEALDEYDRDLDGIAGGLANDRQRNRFIQAAGQRREQLRATGHSVTERKIFQYNNQTLEAMANAEVSNVVQAAQDGNAEQVNLHRITLDGVIDALGDLNGWSDEDKEGRRQKILSGMHRFIVSDMINNSKSAAAREYVKSEDVQSEMTVGDKTLVQNLIKGGIESEMVQSITEEALLQFPDDERAALEHVRKNYSGTEEEKAVRSVKNRYAEIRRIERQEEQDLVGQANRVVFQNRNEDPEKSIRREMGNEAWEKLPVRVKAAYSKRTGFTRKSPSAGTRALAEMYRLSDEQVSNMSRADFLDATKDMNDKQLLTAAKVFDKAQRATSRRQTAEEAAKPSRKRINSLVAKSLSEVGIKPGKARSKSRVKYDDVYSQAVDWVQSRDPKDEEELRKVVDGFVMANLTESPLFEERGRLKRLVGFDATAPIDVDRIPSNDKESIKTAYRRFHPLGEPPTDLFIRNAFVLDQMATHHTDQKVRAEAREELVKLMRAGNSKVVDLPEQ
jgi:hypothetical protein